MEGGLCYFHANPDKAVELGRNGGRRRKHTYEQATEHIAVPESAADVRRILAETMAEVKAGRMDPKVANTVAYVATVLLRAYETDSAPSADTPAQPYVPLIYRSPSPWGDWIIFSLLCLPCQSSNWYRLATFR